MFDNGITLHPLPVDSPICIKLRDTERRVISVLGAEEEGNRNTFLNLWIT